MKSSDIVNVRHKVGMSKPIFTGDVIAHFYDNITMQNLPLTITQICWTTVILRIDDAHNAW